MAVGPLVVAGGVDQRVDEPVELGPDPAEVGVGALGRPALDVAEVVDQGVARVGVDLVDDLRELRELVRPVGDVADHGEVEVPRPWPGEWRS
jgi:hypothetical protein